MAGRLDRSYHPNIAVARLVRGRDTQEKDVKLRKILDRLDRPARRAALGMALLALAAAPAVYAQGAGYWHTSGSQILDSYGNPIRIAGINWFGFETSDQVVHGLNTQDYREILRTISASGFNTIRLPYSNQMVENPVVPTMVNTTAINQDLAGLTSLEIMDKIIAQAGKDGLKVILDNHRSDAGDSNEPNGLWYTSSYPETSWIADWTMLVKRYKNYTDEDGNPVVIGVDLRNEPYRMVNGQPTGSCWTGDASSGGCPITDTAHNWPQAAARAASAVLEANSNLLIFVEGVDCYSGSCNWEGGNLEGARDYPVQMALSSRLVYSVHDYGPEVSTQPWFRNDTTSALLEQGWSKHWAYLSDNNIAPVWLGEFGTGSAQSEIDSTAPGSQGQWFSSLMNFLRVHQRVSWAYWAVNGEDPTGLLTANYTVPATRSARMVQLATIQFPLDTFAETQPQPEPSGTPGAANQLNPRNHSGVTTTAALSLVMFGIVLVQGRKPKRKAMLEDGALDDEPEHEGWDEEEPAPPYQS